MKELNTFRQFLAEGKEEKVSEDKIERAIKDTLKKEGGAAGIDPLKKAVKSLNVDTDFDIEKFLKKMSNVEKHKNGDYILTPLKENDEVLEGVMDKFKKFGKKVKDVADKMEQGEDDEKGVFAALSKKKTQENELHEGTWALGSVAEMVKVMGKLNQIRRMGAARGGLELEDLDTALYNVFGDDEFSDAIDAAKGTDDDDRFNNFIGDAQARAKELYIDELKDAKEQGETGFEFKPRFGLEENDAVLDEVIKENIFKEIDMMIGNIKEQMGPDDAFDSLVSEFEAISGGTKLLHRALKNISLDNNLMEKKDEE